MPLAEETPRLGYDETLADEAKAIVALAFRNGPLEGLHAGITPSSKVGDGSDIKAVSPYGEIPWAKLSRISDAEMKPLIQFAVNKVYTLLVMKEYDREKYDALAEGINPMFTRKWDNPELIQPLSVGMEISKT